MFQRTASFMSVLATVALTTDLASADGDKPLVSVASTTSAPVEHPGLDDTLSPIAETSMARPALPISLDDQTLETAPAAKQTFDLASETDVPPSGEGVVMMNGGDDVHVAGGDIEGEVDIVRAHDAEILYALQQTPTGFWLYRSFNDGASWYQGWGVTLASYESLSMAVAGGYVYVAGIRTSTPDEILLRRYDAETGNLDWDYGAPYSIDLGVEIEEMVLTSTADVGGTHIYVFSLLENGTIDYRWDLANDGQSFESIPTGVTDAVSGLDAIYTSASYYLWFSYVSNDDTVTVGRRNGGGGFELTEIASTSPWSGNRTAISAYGDTTIVAYRGSTNAWALRYGITYDGGAGWAYATLYSGNDGPVAYWDVTARSGAGTAAVYSVELGDFDDVVFRHRSGYQSGAWTEDTINEHDPYTNSEVALTAMRESSPAAAKYDYGLIYAAPVDLWFDRMTNCPADTNGDGVVDVNDLLQLMVEWGSCGGNCDADVTLDGFVDVDDLIYLLSVFGACD